ncbi:hypothetical protein CEXT_148581 [Caerostris extrusa]|uniref:Uncharacterized protein n=1 Tax=Caerostris extrusa TaxID=172846 RepID=A0AAV4V0L5_CAEEX|nr:hypothetical protein CEXT_148581 [Caerostris extrusa]
MNAPLTPFSGVKHTEFVRGHRQFLKVKSDLIELGTELGVTITIVNIKRLITSSENYDEEFVKQVFERIIEERIKREENERLEEENEKQRQIEIEEREKQRQIEIEERKSKDR